MVGHLSPELPSTGQPKSEVIAINDSTINSWCDNCGSRYKQRHAAVMMYAWLQDKLESSDPCPGPRTSDRAFLVREGARDVYQGGARGDALGVPP